MAFNNINLNDAAAWLKYKLLPILGPENKGIKFFIGSLSLLTGDIYSDSYLNENDIEELKDFSGIINILVSGQDELDFSIYCFNGKARFNLKPAKQPTAEIYISSTTFINILSRKISPMKAFMSGKIKENRNGEATNLFCSILNFILVKAVGDQVLNLIYKEFLDFSVYLGK